MTSISITRFVIQIELPWFEEIMKADKSHKFMGFMMNACGSMAQVANFRNSEECSNFSPKSERMEILHRNIWLFKFVCVGWWSHLLCSWRFKSCHQHARPGIFRCQGNHSVILTFFGKDSSDWSETRSPTRRCHVWFALVWSWGHWRMGSQSSWCRIPLWCGSRDACLLNIRSLLLLNDVSN